MKFFYDAFHVGKNSNLTFYAHGDAQRGSNFAKSDLD